MSMHDEYTARILLYLSRRSIFFVYNELCYVEYAEQAKKKALTMLKKKILTVNRHFEREKENIRNLKLVNLTSSRASSYKGIIYVLVSEDEED